MTYASNFDMIPNERTNFALRYGLFRKIQEVSTNKVRCECILYTLTSMCEIHEQCFQQDKDFLQFPAD